MSFGAVVYYHNLVSNKNIFPCVGLGELFCTFTLVRPSDRRDTSVKALRRRRTATRVNGQKKCLLLQLGLAHTVFYFISNNAATDPRLNAMKYRSSDRLAFNLSCIVLLTLLDQRHYERNPKFLPGHQEFHPLFPPASC